MFEHARLYVAAARALAVNGDGDVKKAYRLVRHIVRYALSYARHVDECGTQWPYFTPQSARLEWALGIQRGRLNEAVLAYGCRLVNQGLYPVIISEHNRREVCDIRYLLAFCQA